MHFQIFVILKAIDSYSCRHLEQRKKTFYMVKSCSLNTCNLLSANWSFFWRLRFASSRSLKPASAASRSFRKAAATELSSLKKFSDGNKITWTQLDNKLEITVDELTACRVCASDNCSCLHSPSRRSFSTLKSLSRFLWSLERSYKTETMSKHWRQYRIITPH